MARTSLALPVRHRYQRLLLSLFLAGLVGLSGGSALLEASARQAQKNFARQTRLLDSGFTGADVRDLPPRPHRATAGQRLVDSLFAARAAATLPAGSPTRARLLARASADAASAASTRPHWGEAQIAIAYAASLSGTGATSTPAERKALIRSYDDAPYLAVSGLWRLSRGLAAWPLLPPRTQARLTREILWYICKDPAVRPRLFAEVRASPAYMPVFLAYGRSRDCSVPPRDSRPKPP